MLCTKFEIYLSNNILKVLNYSCKIHRDIGKFNLANIF